MYKSIIKFCAIGLVALSWQACSGVDYDGEYSKDGTFEGMNQVYFDLSNEADTLYSYSFGTQPTSVTTDTVKVRVRIAGVRKSATQQYKVVVDPSSTVVSPTSETLIPISLLTQSSIFPGQTERENMATKRYILIKHKAQHR